MLGQLRLVAGDRPDPVRRQRTGLQGLNHGPGGDARDLDRQQRPHAGVRDPRQPAFLNTQAFGQAAQLVPPGTPLTNNAGVLTTNGVCMLVASL